MSEAMKALELADLYRSESRDQLQRLSRAVLAIERDRDRSAVDEAFRCAHTLKGMAAAMGHVDVVSLAHGLEHLLDRIRSGLLGIDGDVVDVLLSAVSELEQIVEGAVASTSTLANDEQRTAASDEVGGSGGTTSGFGRGEATRYVRADQARIDSLMTRAGELIVAKEALVRRARSLGDAELTRTVKELERLVDDLQADALRLRMAPVGELTDRLHRLVRECGRRAGKQVSFEVTGGNVEIDRSLLGDLSDLLTHLLRNAVDHGIESGRERQASGKSAAGRIRVSAAQNRDSVVVRVADDGCGIDRERVVARAIESGIWAPGTTESTKEADLLELLVLPGFSTATTVTELSGRGVGLDHVASRVRELGGDLRVFTEEGRGTTFTLTLPKTLSLTRVMLVGCGGEMLAIPMGAVERIEDEFQGRVQTLNDAGRKGEVEPALTVALEALCGLPARPRQPGGGYFLVLAKRGVPVKVRVDQLYGFRDVVIKRFAIPKRTRDLYAGAMVLPDGRARLVLDPGRIVARVQWPRSKARKPNP